MTGERIRRLVAQAVAQAALRAPACFLCKYIHEDVERNGRLTETYPEQGPTWMEAPLFPIDAKIDHLILEGFIDKAELEKLEHESASKKP